MTKNTFPIILAQFSWHGHQFLDFGYFTLWNPAEKLEFLQKYVGIFTILTFNITPVSTHIFQKYLL